MRGARAAGFGLRAGRASVADCWSRPAGFTRHRRRRRLLLWPAIFSVRAGHTPCGAAHVPRRARAPAAPPHPPPRQPPAGSSLLGPSAHRRRRRHPPRRRAILGGAGADPLPRSGCVRRCAREVGATCRRPTRRRGRRRGGCKCCVRRGGCFVGLRLRRQPSLSLLIWGVRGGTCRCRDASAGGSRPVSSLAGRPCARAP
mmetsp:Transcript_9845/g.31733  ORF Transcript_9845/g.31733 Transcript_9845/m.31733 type:complete len:200 (-) Transcript_9845:710-1309(-)